MLEKYLERQRRGSFDNQRVELSEEQLLEMSAADLARYVENMHAMRLQVCLLHSALFAGDVQSAYTKSKVFLPFTPPGSIRVAAAGTPRLHAEHRGKCCGAHAQHVHGRPALCHVCVAAAAKVFRSSIPLIASMSRLAADGLAQLNGRTAGDEPRVASPGHLA